jgi:hypothetical protein
MQRRARSLVAAVVLVACADDAGTGDGSSGIRGRAMAGPQCPVVVEGSPCPDLPWRGTVVATEVGTGDRSTVETDRLGRFELTLEPGTYEITIDAGAGLPSAEPRTVTVEAGRFTHVDVAVDTGIR